MNPGTPRSDARFEPRRVLKSDLFGVVEEGLLLDDARPGSRGLPAVRRDTRGVRWWLRPTARWLLRRELAALAALTGVPGVPRLLVSDGRWLVRTWIDGAPLQQSPPADPAWFADARRLLARVHRAGVAHNDLAKEPNWLVTPEGRPALVDFQLASVSPRRGRLFRLSGREDLRHLLKHKRTYRRELLSARERHLLAHPSGPARALRRGMKPLYNLVTRRWMGWSDREGAPAERRPGDRRPPA